MSIVIEKQIELDSGSGGSRSQYPTKAKALPACRRSIITIIASTETMLLRIRRRYPPI